MLLPDTLTTIGENAFFDCKSLVTVTLGSSLKKINLYAFYGCESLKRIDLPATVTHIGTWAFHNCFDMHTITFGGTVAEITAAVGGRYLGDHIPSGIDCSDGDFRLPSRPF